jgi:hypothetical protein
VGKSFEVRQSGYHVAALFIETLCGLGRALDSAPDRRALMVIVIVSLGGRGAALWRAAAACIGVAALAALRFQLFAAAQIQHHRWVPKLSCAARSLPMRTQRQRGKVLSAARRE